MFRLKNIVQRWLSTSVPIETDVINVHFSGGGILSRFKRRWFDLFLLSYEDSLSKHYYMSSHGMMMARAAQFYNNRGSIHPFSKFRNFWDCFTLHLLIIRSVMFQFNSSVIHQPNIFCAAILVLCDFIFIFDLYINSITGYAIKRTRQVVLNTRDILYNYLSSNAFFHAITAIPIECLMFLRLGNEINSQTARANLFVCTLKIICVLNVVKLLQISAYWEKDRGNFGRTMTFKFVRIIVVGLVTTYAILALTTALSTIATILKGSIQESTYNGHMILYKYIHLRGQNNENTILAFMRLSRVCRSFFLFGFTVLPNTDISDHISTILTYWVASMFHSWAGIVLYNCVARDNSLEDRLYVARAQTFNVLRIRGLPDEIHTKVIKYYDYKMSSLIILEKKNCLYRSLPRVLLSEIKMNCFKDNVVKIPCFSEWPPEVIGKIVDLLQPEIYLSKDLVNSAQSSHNGLVILEAGLMAVYSAGREIGHHADGDYIAETSLVIDEPMTTNDIVAVTPCTVLLLDKIGFRKMMAEYPDLFCSLRIKSILAEVTGHRRNPNSS